MSKTEEKKGIPQAVFIENVEEFVAKAKKDPEGILKELHQMYGKYKYIENTLVTQKSTLLKKIPDINKALKALRFLIKKQEEEETIECQFELSDAIFGNASVTPCNSLLLWLGANVMVEYTYDEALGMLEQNVQNAETNLKNLETDLSILKDQITISEVNIARVHNYKVQLKSGKK